MNKSKRKQSMKAPQIIFPSDKLLAVYKTTKSFLIDPLRHRYIQVKKM